MSLFARFPALARLGARRQRRSLRYISQLAETDCAAACLLMVLDYHGKQVPLSQLAEMLGAGRDGSTALAIVEVAQELRMRARGVRVDLDDLGSLPTGAILHWEFRHFVVFERVRRSGVDIIDPDRGRIHVPLAEFGGAFTGVAVVLEPTDEFQRGDASRKSRRILRYLRQILSETGALERLLSLSLAMQVFGLAVPLLTSAIVDRVVPLRDQHLLSLMAIGFGVLAAFVFISSLVRAHVLLALRAHVDSRMTLGFIDHLVELPYSYFQARSAGDLMMRLNSNTTVRETLTASALSALLDGAMVLLYLLLLVSFSGPLALLVVGIGALRVIVFVATRRRQRDLMSETLQAQVRSQSYQVEMFTGIETLKSMGAERQAVDHWSNLFVDELNVVLRRGRLDAAVDALMGLLDVVSPLLILMFGAMQVLEGELSLGAMLGLTALAAGFLRPLGELVATAFQLQTLTSYLDRLDEVFDTPAEQDREVVVRAPHLQGQIDLRDVSFRYGPRGPLVVRNVTLSIAPGSFVAIVGSSGAGKSTLASLLLGLYQPTEGELCYDGLDLRSLDAVSVRRQLGIVTQQPYLFAASIRRNISLADPTMSLEAVTAAARLAHIHDDIARMPLGYETPLLDRGESLSGGQRQRIALARALARRPSILLLDEATSALDATTEAAIWSELEALRATRIVIAHRLSTVVNADLILVMDGGQLLEHGTHDQLMRARGRYAQLVAAQMVRTSRADDDITLLDVPRFATYVD